MPAKEALPRTSKVAPEPDVEGVAVGVTVGAGHAAPFPRSQHFSVPHGATRSGLPALAWQYWTSQRSLGNVPSISLS